MRDTLGAAALLLCSTFFIAGLMLTAPVAPGQAVAAIFPPWLNKTEILGAVSTAGGRMLRHGGIDSVALVRLETPDDVQRLKHAGAWAVVAPAGLFGCGGVTDAAQRLFQKET
ncbi:hypothetical protein [Nisaea denitrificans]|uniref:hypothetical protein n=1 Tax=Nisaea denitrificans TaxID=390877 RepID=UPI00040FF6D1|nr:hypothetical protein [Nisaea denitrificans]